MAMDRLMLGSKHEDVSTNKLPGRKLKSDLIRDSRLVDRLSIKMSKLPFCIWLPDGLCRSRRFAFYSFGDLTKLALTFDGGFR